ncbi:MAG: protein translocase subunit SecD [Candidatus Komeilibacteria bacterium CG11_big_fil_rev_8_21_14_0_20_36_20]|uniref:Protein translocase subunit SecD n=2 Tax=Patescibacteria group TaxID=1783273 RepID=A0A2H0NBJ4_9BACT|nr:MAG: protein translocase subunit SecD [Candidatus Komeilibacteria bacterium CG11_big_fil_rev_8_21_14_0_20_36_20]PIR81700.1 MAG: protein translocase subunit SecD [Candidatus Komeilibacteria bacterium CG10_big_fil_rev_8_21_14_0_10_36_65]PIZ66389.1 MAG: protein translocase subunit SecD [Candidatus Roizmanbacteria bacterium CG_4_10_14_0_2_um_filter_36_9]PJC54899.1 MAG: protein translocase subunit SecD [Candidatus Komeilibacteria bacterium CG_4_9_14_0_2_um_filter_36_13]
MNKYGHLSSKGQITTTKVRITALFIFVLTILAALIVYPKSPGWFSNFKVHLGLDLQGGTHLIYQADISDLGDVNIEDSISALRDVIERRVNNYGVSEPVVQTNYSGDNYRIIVELAGVTDIKEAISIIDKTPLLDFRIQEEVSNDSENQINEIKQEAQAVLERALAGEDFAALAKEYSQDPGSAEQGGDLSWVTKGIFVPEFDTVIFDQLKVGEIAPELVESQFGYHIIKKIDERLNDQGKIEVHAAHILFAKADADIIWKQTGLDGKDVQKAQLTFAPNTQEPLVILDFNEEGKDLFAQLTTDNVGKPIGIFLDNALRSSPIVQEPIKDGSAQISGNFTIEEAKQLIKDLNLGALPVPIKLISQQTVGASLGEVSVQKSLLAGIIGLIAAALFMLLFYRLPGLISIIALAIYTIISLAIFEIIPVTMTLAGVAGFILSIGMAVDANVLIFERTKEELYQGRSLNSSIENGFLRAWSSIRDSNISSIITCLILAWFGTSIIKGFAITLAIGIMISMFSAITITRTLLRLIVNKKLEDKLYLFGVRKMKSKEE